MALHLQRACLLLGLVVMTDISHSLTDLGHVTSATEFSHYFLSKFLSSVHKILLGAPLVWDLSWCPWFSLQLVSKFIFGDTQAVIIIHKLISFIFAAIEREEQGGAGQLPGEGAGALHL